MNQQLRNKKIEERNANLISLFLFQYSILIPIMIFMNATLLVSILSTIILIIAVINNKRIIINPKILLLFFVILLLILLKTLLYHNGGYSVLVSYFTIACPALYIISLPFNKNKFMETSYRLAIISFFLICWIPLSSVGINYMRFGYGMAPVTVFLYCRLTHQKDFSKKRFTLGIILLLSLIEILVFGARGSMIPIIIMIVLDKLFINKAKYKIIPLIVIAIATYFNLESIINALFNVLKKLDIHSYSLTKIRMQFNKGFAEASSGRDAIYGNTISNIKQNLFLGNDLAGGVGDTYTHNVFLQMTEEFGIFGIAIFFIFLVHCIVKICNKKILENDRLILAILLSLSMGRLLFSSSYWMRPEFWLFVGFGLLINDQLRKTKKARQ